MNLFFAGLLIVGVASVAITAMLLVRRRAPAGSWFVDGDRAAGVFGVIATGFAVMLGFVIFLAFESYDTSRSGAEAEAQVVAQQLQTSELFPAPVRRPLANALVCYARDVAYTEWPKMRSGQGANLINPWSVVMFRSLQTVEPRTAAEQAAYSKWLDQSTDRQSARSDRTHGAEGVIPAPLWIVLFLSAGIIFVFMLFFADPEEHVLVQATMMGGVAVMITSMLLLLWFLDNPYHPGVGGLPPTAMKRTLASLDQQAKIVGITIGDACDAKGIAR